MNAKSLLDQLLTPGQSILSNTLGNQAPGRANFGTGLLAGGVLGLLLGDKRVQKFGGKALAYSGAAALGALAFALTATGSSNPQAVQPLRSRPKRHNSFLRQSPRVTAARC
jgi:uncharacterized membrane protein YebE (DUF533 family)